MAQRAPLPVAVGFGINTPEQAATVARVADAAVVGTAVVKIIGDHQKHPTETVAKTHRFIAELAAGVRGARVTA